MNDRPFLATTVDLQSRSSSSQGFKGLNDRSSDDFDPNTSVDDQMDKDLAQYNQMFESHQLFKHQFDLQKRKYELALQNSLTEILQRLPPHIQNMNAQAFLERLQDPVNSFEQLYNLEFRVPEIASTLGMLGHIQNLIKPTPKQSRSVARSQIDIEQQQLPVEIISEVQMKDASTLEVYDKEIQCRFSISKVGSGRNSLGRPQSPIKPVEIPHPEMIDYGVQVFTETLPQALEQPMEEVKSFIDPPSPTHLLEPPQPQVDIFKLQDQVETLAVQVERLSMENRQFSRGSTFKAQNQQTVEIKSVAIGSGQSEDEDDNTPSDNGSKVVVKNSRRNAKKKKRDQSRNLKKGKTVSREKDIEEEEKKDGEEADENSQKKRKSSVERVSRFYSYKPIPPAEQAAIEEANKHSPGIQTRRRHQHNSPSKLSPENEEVEKEDLKAIKKKAVKRGGTKSNTRKGKVMKQTFEQDNEETVEVPSEEEEQEKPLKKVAKKGKKLNNSRSRKR